MCVYVVFVYICVGDFDNLLTVLRSIITPSYIILLLNNGLQIDDVFATHLYS